MRDTCGRVRVCSTRFFFCRSWSRMLGAGWSAISRHWAGRLFATLLLILGSGRLGLGLYAWQAANRLERPTYEVLKKLAGGVELRRYEPYLIAETELQSSGMGLNKGTGEGFRTVAGYIFGKNKPNAKMAMTAPVRTAQSGGESMAMTAPVRSSYGSSPGKTKVSFVIGKQYSKGSAPQPMDKAVRLKDVAPHSLAVRKFAGPPPSERRVEREKAIILAALAEQGLQPGDDEVLVYGYHDPFITPNFLRRNEVGIRVSGSV